MEIKGKVVIVTGASSGIGEAIARQFGWEDAKVVLAARRLDRLEALAQEIDGLGRGAETLVVQMDISKQEDIQSLIKQTMNRFGRIDVLVNNAGFGRLDWLENLDPEKDIEAQFDVDVLGVVQTSRQVLPVMIRQRSGHIINMCSIAGLIATPTYTIYAACKHAVHGFSEALRREVKPWGIDVSMIYPGGVTTTEFGQHATMKRKTQAGTPQHLLLSPEDVARAVVQVVRRPRAIWIIPWMWNLLVLSNKLFPTIMDTIAINRFTIPERAEELQSK